MKTLRLPPLALFSAVWFIAPVTLAQPAGGDPFEVGMRQAYLDYQKGANEAVISKLKELVKILEEKSAATVVRLLPDQLGEWHGETVQENKLEFAGGGSSIARTYVLNKRSVNISVVKNSPIVKALVPLLTNEDLIRASNRKTHRISGETAVMQGEDKLQMVVDGRIYVELTAANGAGESEMVTLARLLDLQALAKLK